VAKHLNFVTLWVTAASTTRTVNPASSGTVVAGTRFTPTAGRRLVAIAGGAITQTAPTGWLPNPNVTGQNAVVNNGGHYVWNKVAAGGDTLTTTTNGTGAWPSIYTFLEFEAGSTVVAFAGAGNVAVTNGAGPTLTMPAGTKTVYAAGNGTLGGSVGASASWTFSGATEFVDAIAPNPGTGPEGASQGVAYVEDTTSTSLAVTASVAYVNASSTPERLIFAVSVAASQQPSGLPVRVAQSDGSLAAAWLKVADGAGGLVAPGAMKVTT